MAPDDAARDALLSDNDREEALSWAYVRAVAAYAGYTISVQDFDRGGVDLSVHGGGALNPLIDIQLKATTRLGAPHADGSYSYPVPVRDYNRLIRSTVVPQYLVIMALPADPAEWLSVSDTELALRRCAYWVSLRGMPQSGNIVSETVRVPGANLFDAAALRRMMADAQQEMQR